MNKFMLLKVPFYKNNRDSTQCAQVAMRSVLKYYTGKTFSLKDLDETTGRRGSYWTWTVQMVVGLHELGLDVKNYCPVRLEPLLLGEPYIRKFFGKDADKVLQKSELPVLFEFVKKTQEYRLYSRKKFTISDIERHLSKNHLPLVFVDFNILHKKRGTYGGHFVVVTGFDRKNIFYHESEKMGTKPTPNLKIPKSEFKKAAFLGKKYQDIIIVYGMRKGRPVS